MEASTHEIELTVLMSRPNESRILPERIRDAPDALNRYDARSDALIADDGSIDDSRIVAESPRARAGPVATRGCGSVLRTGLAAARPAIFTAGCAR